MRNDWVEIELGKVSESIQYGYTAASSRAKIGPKLLRITDIQDDKVDWENVPFCEIDAEKISNYLLEEGDLVFARTGATVGKSLLLKNKVPHSVFASYLIRVRVKKELLEQKFLAYFFKSPFYWQQITENQAGIGQPNVNGSKLKKLFLHFPPLPEQRAIVSKIEQLFSELDNGIANLKTAKQKLEIYRQAVLKKAFEGKLTNSLNSRRSGTSNDLKDKYDDHDFSLAAEPEVPYLKNQGHQENQRNHSLSRPSGSSDNLPEGWRWVKLGDFGKWKGGGTPSKSKVEYWENGDVLWVSPKDMKTKTILDTQDKITELSIEQSSAKWIEKGAILFVVRSGILRRTLPIALAGRRLTVNQDLQSFLPNDKLQSDFVYWYCVSQERDIREKCSKDGTTVESIESTLLKNYPLPLCSIEEQTQIVQEIESRLSVCDKLSVSIDESLEKAEALRQSILKKAFEGKLLTEAELEACRKEPDWEPAERLLERIVSEHDERIKR